MIFQLGFMFENVKPKHVVLTPSFCTQRFRKVKVDMKEEQIQTASTNLSLELQKQQYQTPTLEQHHFLSLTGVGLSIGGAALPNPLEVVVPNPFELQDLQ